MLYGVLADIVVVIHLLWILFLISGAYWGRKRRPVMAVHASGLLFSIAMQVFGWHCPLTHIEVWLRAKQNPLQTYPGSFIAHYAEKLVYIEISPLIIFVLTVILVGVNGWAYRRAFRLSRPV